MIQGLGAAVLEDAEPAELALADVEAAHLLELDAEAIVRQWDPFEVPARNLKVLAFAMGVTLWDDAWAEGVKRQWIADQWKFKALVGTEAAIRMALDLWGYTLVETLTPPQGFYLSEELTAEQRNGWLALMPQFRLQVGVSTGTGPIGEWFLGDGFLGEAAITVNDGPTLIGRRGFLRRNGVDTPLDLVTVTSATTQSTLVEVERIRVPGLSTVGWFLGEDFLGEADHYLDAAELEAEVVTVRLDRTVDRTTQTLGLNTVSPGLEPLDVRPKRISDVGDGGDAWFLGEDFLGERFLVPDDAGMLLADVLFLNDPTVSVPMVDGASFLGVDRFGMDPHTAELMIDLHQEAEPDGFFLGQVFLGESFLIPEDTTARENAFRAVLAATALRDTVLVSFAPRRPLQFVDPIGPGTKAGDWVPDRL
jgi:hypothetical protein